MHTPITPPVICLITPGARTPWLPAIDPSDEIVNMAAQASSAGIDFVHLREPNLTDRTLYMIARRVLGVVDPARTRVFVNNRPDVALAAGVDGVHLPADAMRASRVRAIAPQGFLIGRSVHSIDEAREAQEDGGVDYLIFGTVFRSASKPDAHTVAGLAALREVCGAVRMPVIAVGGITVERAPEIAGTGAAGIAAIGLFADVARADALELSGVVRRIRRAFDTRSPGCLE